MRSRWGTAGILLILAMGPTACSSGSARVVLAGQDLGVVEIGTPFQTAVAQLTRALGPPEADPAPGRSCPGSAREVRWPGLRIGEKGGVLFGWVSTSGDLATDKGIRVGSSQTDLEKAYRSDLALVPATGGVGNAFSIATRSLVGNLDPSGTVTALFSGGCGA